MESDTNHTEAITLKEIQDLLKTIPNHTWNRDMVHKDLNNMGINPVFFYFRKDDEVVQVDKRKLMVFRLKYGI